MKNNFPIKFKIFDVFVVAFSVVCIVLSIIFTNVFFSNEVKDSSLIQVYYQGQILEEYQVRFSEIDDEIEITLTKDQYDKLLGDFTIVINKEHGVSVKDVTCPNHYCEKMGWIHNVGYPLVCLPNGVYVIITTSEVNQDIIFG